MATQVATLTFALPENVDSDFLRIYESSSEASGYTLVLSAAYEYGTTRYEYDSLDDTKWYKIQFFNSTDNIAGPVSEPVYGGTYTAASPFVAISTQSDGANYATTQDVYDYADNLTPEDISERQVSAALRRARAVIDYRSEEVGINRFDFFTTEVARRKYNASLRLLKEAEITRALSIVYNGLADNGIMTNIREGGGTGSGSISIGGVGISGDSLGERTENILFFAALADKYLMISESIMSQLQGTSVVLVPYDWQAYVRSPRFVYPFNGYGR